MREMFKPVFRVISLISDSINGIDLNAGLENFGEYEWPNATTGLPYPN